MTDAEKIKDLEMWVEYWKAKSEKAEGVIRSAKTISFHKEPPGQEELWERVYWLTDHADNWMKDLKSEFFLIRKESPIKPEPMPNSPTNH